MKVDCNNCIGCTNLTPITKPDTVCDTKKKYIDEIRIYCTDNITETIIASSNGCDIGYINDFVLSADAIAAGETTPMIAVDVLNPDDVDELNDYTFDRDELIGEETYSLSPIKIKVYNANQQCTLDSLKGKCIGVVYKINNADNSFGWRRMIGVVSNVTGGLINGYELTIDIEDPEDVEKPLYVNLGSLAATETAMDTLTVF